MTSSGKEQKKNMTNYIVNKTTTEVFVVIADDLKTALKMAEEGHGEQIGHNINYSARPQGVVQQVAPK